MHPLRLLPALLALSLIAPTAMASAKKPAATRALASIKLVFKINSPEVQRLENDEAKAAFELFTSQHLDKADQKTFGEFELQMAAMASRGFEARSLALSGRVFGEARSFVVYRKAADSVPSLEGAPAYTSLMFDFIYTQKFLEKGKAPTPNSILPEVELRGMIFVHCPEKETTCELSSVGVRETAIRWEYLPSGRGANSSAGGAGQN